MLVAGYLGSAIVFLLLSKILQDREKEDTLTNPFLKLSQFILYALAFLMVILTFASMLRISEIEITDPSVNASINSHIDAGFTVNLYAMIVIIILIFIMFLLYLFNQFIPAIKKFKG